MKKGICIIMLAMILIAISICEELIVHDINTNLKKYSVKLHETISASSNLSESEEIQKEYKQLNEYWSNQKIKVCVFANYEKIKSIDECIYKLDAAIKNDDKSLAVENISSIEAFTHFLHYFMGFNIHNLF